MKEVAVIDYGAGNIASLINSLEYLNRKVVVLKKPSKLKFSHIILPGVGSFGKLSENLKKLSFDQYLNESLKKGSYLFGICVGMQLLFEESEESDGYKGLELIKGKFKKINSGSNNFLPLPHIGFSKVKNMNSKLFKNIPNEAFFYFIHSYYLSKIPSNSNYCVSQYGEDFVSFIEKENVYGSQFHPEKSHKIGLKLINNFLNL